MEEAWELAALIMEDSTKIDGKPVEWSGRHIRLKYQMVIACLIFFSVANYGFKEFKFLPVLLEETPSSNEILIGTCAFATFSVIAFLMRSINENVSKSSISINVSNEFSLAKSSINSVIEGLKRVSEFNHKEFRRELGDYKTSLENTVKVVEAIELLPLKDIKAISFPAQEKLNLLDNEVATLLTAIPMSLDDDKLDRITFSNDSFMKGFNKLIKTSNEVADLATRSHNLRLTIDRTQQELSKVNEFNQNNLKSRLEDALGYLDKSDKSLTKLQSRFSSLNYMHLFERSGLSVWVPILVSLGLLIWGLDEAIPQILEKSPAK